LISASGREHHQHGPRSWVPLDRPGTDLRHATAPRALADAGGAPDGAGETTGARSERRGWVRVTGRSEKRTRQDGGTCGEMDVATNAEWSRWTAARRVKHAIGKKVGRYFRERYVRHKEVEAGLVGRAGPGRRRALPIALD
jgi:hypothetical protein